jgi:hypothetical protein
MVETSWERFRARGKEIQIPMKIPIADSIGEDNALRAQGIGLAPPIHSDNLDLSRKKRCFPG